MLRGQSRREIGHGALAERALEPVIPSEEVFPYTLRLVSEVLSSNGSSSMGSVCGSTLALMDTGVPIKAPVAGVAMGLIKEQDQYAILTDIQGLEDHLGDMDFKVAGTADGHHRPADGHQDQGLDLRDHVRRPWPRLAPLACASWTRCWRSSPHPRPELKPHVPRIIIVKIPIDKIGAIIGPGGKNIRALQEETNTKIDIDDDGTVFIAATDKNSEMMARERIEAHHRNRPSSVASTPARSCASPISAPSSRSCPTWTAWCTSPSSTPSA